MSIRVLTFGSSEVLTWINGSGYQRTYAGGVITKLLALALFSAQLATAADGPGSPPSRDARFEFSMPKDEGLLTLNYGGRKLLVYAFGTNQFKPYVRELRTLKGDNVLVDAPPDHLHHHGLMYGIRVNGVNFWEEREQPGHQIPVRLSPPKVGRSTSGLPQASFSQEIHWVSHTNATVADTASVALLIEQRTLTLTVDEGSGEVALDWRSEFQVGPGTAKVTLAGANYHGLGLRLPESFNKVAQHQNSENAPYPTRGTGDVTRARWSSVSHAIDGREITVALFGSPAAGRANTFFTMVQPFTYLSVTQGLDKAPLEYSAGDKFKLDYLLVVYSDHRAPEFLQKRFGNWKP